MRLLNTEALQLETIYCSDVPRYAALSHTWGDEEVTFQDLTTDFGREKTSGAKNFGSSTEGKKHNCKCI